jgi:hypothetical protein
MKKIISLAVVFLFSINMMSAQSFNPAETEKSLVRVEIKHGTKGYACTGFIWKKENQIVTSLHAMKTGATYQVVYNNKYYRDATVDKVYKEADLVLLTVDLITKPLSELVIPIRSFSPDKVQSREKLYAQGYHGGSTGHFTKSLEKGHANPEILEKLVVKESEKNLLIKLGFPKINLPVLFLDGSLLPGFSGSPIYNTKGELVGIGNGGLENGAIGVSWAIPASYLTALEQSQTKILPQNLDQISLLMSSQVEVDLSSATGNDVEIQQKMEEQYAVYEGGGLEFIKTKNRSFEQMYNSSYDPENLDYFADDLHSNGLQINYNFIRYDIFENLDFDVTIAIPEGGELYYDPANGVFTANLISYPLHEYFSLEYYGFTDEAYTIENVDVAADLVLDQLNLAIGQRVSGFTEDEDYSYSIEIDEDREMVYILYQGNEPFLDDDQNEYLLGIYLTVLKDQNKIFYSMATITVPIYELADAFANGIDCVNNYESNPEYCAYFEQYMRVIAACHLTTFSSINFTMD